MRWPATFLLQVYGATRVNARFTPNLNLSHPGFRLFLRLTIPIMLALSLAFTDDWIIRWFGSYLQPASITWLSYGKTLMRVPLGVVGQGVGVASFPFLSRNSTPKAKFDELNRLLDSTTEGLDRLACTHFGADHGAERAAGLSGLPHTRMHASDLDATAATLVFFSLGMFAWGAQNILARGFYATRNTMTPAIVGTAVTFGSLPVYWLLVRRTNYLGLALASTLGIVTYTAALIRPVSTCRTQNRRYAGATGCQLFFLKVCAASLAVGWI